VAGPPLKTSSALGRGRGNAPLPCTPSPNQIQTSKSGSFYLAKNRNFLLGLDTKLVGRQWQKIFAGNLE